MSPAVLGTVKPVPPLPWEVLGREGVLADDGCLGLCGVAMVLLGSPLLVRVR